MIPFLLVIFSAPILIIGLWNRASDFRSAFLQSLLFLEVMNWYDGIVIDKLWVVGHSKFRVIPELKGIPYVKTWKQILIKKGDRFSAICCDRGSYGGTYCIDFLMKML